MPAVDDFARAQPLPTLPSTADVVRAARQARGAALRAWMAAAWRVLLKRVPIEWNRSLT
jgi:hypothetical protein